MAKRNRTRSRPRPGGGEREERRAEVHATTATARTGEALSRGTVVPRVPEEPVEMPGQEEVLRAGDPDVSALTAAHVGDEVPGGSMPTPDQDSVDAVGRAMGVDDGGPGGLRSSAEIMEERDRHRAQQDQPDPATRGRYRRP